MTLPRPLNLGGARKHVPDTTAPCVPHPMVPVHGSLGGAGSDGLSCADKGTQIKTTMTQQVPPPGSAVLFPCPIPSATGEPLPPRAPWMIAPWHLPQTVLPLQVGEEWAGWGVAAEASLPLPSPAVRASAMCMVGGPRPQQGQLGNESGKEGCERAPGQEAGS